MSSVHNISRASLEREKDVREDVFARVALLLVHPRILGFTRTSCRLLYVLVAICLAFIVLVSVQQFTAATLRTLYIVITIALLLHVIFNSYYTLLLARHYSRIRYYLRRRVASAFLFGSQVLQIVLTLVFMVFVLVVEVITIS